MPLKIDITLSTYLYLYVDQKKIFQSSHIYVKDFLKDLDNDVVSSDVNEESH